MPRTGIVSPSRTILYALMCPGLSVVLSSCYYTSVGHWDEDSYEAQPYGRWRTVHVCVYLDSGVSKSQALSLMSDWIKPDGVAQYYQMKIEPEGFWTLPRTGFLHNTLMNEIAHIPLEGECDRLFYFVNHSMTDYLYANIPMMLAGISPPEVLGEVDDATMTHGFAFAQADSLTGLVIGSRQTTWHEFYHLLGSCPHAWTLKQCYARISLLKSLPSTDGMYPSMNAVGNRTFLSRTDVNRVMAKYSDSMLPWTASNTTIHCRLAL
jgi:hypothetical protein